MDTTRTATTALFCLTALLGLSACGEKNPNGKDNCPAGQSRVGGVCKATSCNTDASVCGDAERCVEHADGAWRCECLDGYALSGETCVDVDECALEAPACPSEATCHNSEPGFYCDCPDGYTHEGDACVDVDECTLGTDDCVAPEACVNTDGGFECGCAEGYQDNGSGCENIDECTEGTATCDGNATCTDTDGGYDCACDEGYTGDGQSCADVDECDAATDECPADSTCVNTDGAYTCECSSGSFDGKDCVSGCRPGQIERNGLCYPFGQDVALGNGHACVLNSDNTASCWGHGFYGPDLPESAGTFESLHGGAVVFGLDTFGAATSIGPDTFAPPAEQFTQMCSNSSVACGVRADGTVNCWSGSVSFTAAANAQGPFSKVTCGLVHACALKTDGSKVWCMGGTNNHGERNAKSGAVGEFVDIVSNQYTNALLRSDGSIEWWGMDIYSTYDIPTTPTDFEQIVGGSGYLCARTSTGDVTCWGSFGATGTDGLPLPTDMAFVKIAGGFNDTCGLRADGTVECWGRYLGRPVDPGTSNVVDINVNGSCALDATGYPVCSGVLLPDSIGKGPFEAIGTGANSACGVDSLGALDCWGLNTSVNNTAPTSGTFVSAQAAGVGMCAQKDTGAVVCWGAGATTVGLDTVPPVGFKSYSAGYQHACGVTLADEVQCWGSNADGQAPATLSGSYIAVGAGSKNTCVIDTSGALSCVGAVSGDLLTPPAGTFTQVAVSSTDACAIDDSGAAVCWGAHHPSLYSPPPSDETFTEIWAENDAYCALTTDGYTRCWGAWRR